MDFCRFMTQFNAARICLGHLHEVSREGSEYWSYAHAGLLMDQLLALRSETMTVTARTGMSLELWPSSI